MRNWYVRMSGEDLLRLISSTPNVCTLHFSHLADDIYFEDKMSLDETDQAKIHLLEGTSPLVSSSSILVSALCLINWLMHIDHRLRTHAI